jgi:hypothetical protein
MLVVMTRSFDQLSMCACGVCIFVRFSVNSVCVCVCVCFVQVLTECRCQPRVYHYQAFAILKAYSYSRYLFLSSSKNLLLAE